MKKCFKCKRMLSEDNFYKDASQSCGLKGSCKSCNTILCKKYRQRNRTAMRAYSRRWTRAHPAKHAEYGRRYRQNHFAHALIQSAKARAKLKKVPFDLDAYREEIKQRVEKWECELTGMKLDRTGRRSFNSPSIDRIVPARGYIYSNIRIVSYAVNCALGTWGEEKLRIIAAALLGRG